MTRVLQDRGPRGGSVRHQEVESSRRVSAKERSGEGLSLEGIAWIYGGVCVVNTQ